MKNSNNIPRLIFWELTKKCNLKCIYCRAEADSFQSNDLSLHQITAAIDTIAKYYKPIIVLTGGEPLYRKDIFDIAEYIHNKDMPVALATNGTLITKEIAGKIKKHNIRRVSITLDAGTASLHDSIRGIKGSFNDALKGVDYLAAASVEFQFNTTITKQNVKNISEIVELAKEKRAKALHIFLLVPVGCGVEISEDEMISVEQYESVLHQLYDYSTKNDLEIKATCAPHYYRIIRQRAKEESRTLSFEKDGLAAVTKGCLAGSGVCFISNTGDVQPCGYLPLAAGNITEKSFNEIWESAELFKDLRDYSKLEGKCGDCEYIKVCSGCRARAYFQSGSIFAEEPFCLYEPKKIPVK